MDTHTAMKGLFVVLMAFEVVAGIYAESGWMIALGVLGLLSVATGRFDRSFTR